MATLADYQATALTNCDYLSAASATKAAAYISAVEAMLILHASGSHDGASVTINPEVWQARLSAAQEWLAAKGQASSYTRHSFEGFRD